MNYVEIKMREVRTFTIRLEVDDKDGAISEEQAIDYTVERAAEGCFDDSDIIEGTVDYIEVDVLEVYR